MSIGYIMYIIMSIGTIWSSKQRGPNPNNNSFIRNNAADAEWNPMVPSLLRSYPWGWGPFVCF